METVVSLVITSIASPNSILKTYSAECIKRNINFILIGDKKSPVDFELEGCQFYSVNDQKKLSYKSSPLIPENHYARKNIGYLLALSSKAEIIIETDDDNAPLKNFWKFYPEQLNAYCFKNKGWLNIYRYFTDKNIWPRGFPLDEIITSYPILKEARHMQVTCPIQQGLADGNPDVDAVFRLTKELPIKFKNHPPIALGNDTWCPFNSQNTRWYKRAFPLLYLPSFTSFRMTDIWRSFVAQRICQENNWSVLFHKATVVQDRNEHDLMNDLEEEIPGYINNRNIIKCLNSLALKAGEDHLFYNLKKCYEGLIRINIMQENEMDLLEAWCTDCSNSVV